MALTLTLTLSLTLTFLFQTIFYLLFLFGTIFNCKAIFVDRSDEFVKKSLGIAVPRVFFKIFGVYHLFDVRPVGFFEMLLLKYLSIPRPYLSIHFIRSIFCELWCWGLDHGSATKKLRRMMVSNLGIVPLKFQFRVSSTSVGESVDCSGWISLFKTPQETDH